MKIGIIGSGNIGGTLTRRLTALDHEVKVANSRGPESTEPPHLPVRRLTCSSSAGRGGK
ncbi:NAD(P)-binding domain-containing protein [Kribbella sp. DT2]|uniref:NAD(P)-binding domain-containing protein n=1 Tax=Kribbella sp. DT2 TaxID=3393427 RepID=UPI003CF80766